MKNFLLAVCMNSSPQRDVFIAIKTFLCVNSRKRGHAEIRGVKNYLKEFSLMRISLIKPTHHHHRVSSCAIYARRNKKRNEKMRTCHENTMRGKLFHHHCPRRHNCIRFHNHGSKLFLNERILSS